MSLRKAQQMCSLKNTKNVRVLVRVGLALFAVLTISIGSYSQKATGSASARGTCNQVSSGSNNQFVINCGVGAAQGKEIVDLLNTILKKQLDIGKLVGQLSEQNETLLSYGSPVTGELLPGSAPDPPDECRGMLPTGGYKVFVGGSVTWNATLPMWALKSGPRDYVYLLPNGKGLSVSALITEPSGKIITKIENNRFIVNPNNTIDRVVSPDRTTLKVIDELGNLALSVQFINPTSIKVLGRFSTSSGQMIIEDGRMVYGGTTFSKGCTIGAPVAFEFQ